MIGKIKPANQDLTLIAIGRASWSMVQHECYIISVATVAIIYKYKAIINILLVSRPLVQYKPMRAGGDY